MHIHAHSTYTYVRTHTHHTHTNTYIPMHTHTYMQIPNSEAVVDLYMQDYNFRKHLNIEIRTHTDITADELVRILSVICRVTANANH